MWFSLRPRHSYDGNTSFFPPASPFLNGSVPHTSPRRSCFILDKSKGSGSCSVPTSYERDREREGIQSHQGPLRGPNGVLSTLLEGWAGRRTVGPETPRVPTRNITPGSDRPLSPREVTRVRRLVRDGGPWTSYLQPPGPREGLREPRTRTRGHG